jgi:uncharacterized protein YecT (DUF1311 family)
MDSAMTSLDMRDCGAEELRRLNSALTSAWKAAQARFSDPSEPFSAAARQRLLDEQRAWIRFKDVACGYFYETGDFGTMGPSATAPPCLAAVFRERIRYLVKLAKGEW